MNYKRKYSKIILSKNNESLTFDSPKDAAAYLNVPPSRLYALLSPTIHGYSISFEALDNPDKVACGCNIPRIINIP